MLNNRQGNNNRRRGRNNNQRPQTNGQNRNGDNSNRIDNRARGNAPQLLEKYRALARDAQMAGDRVLTEYYHQFADHYFRVVAETRARFEDNRRPREDWEGGDEQTDGRAEYDDGDDDDFNERTFDDNRRTQVQQPQQRQPNNADRQPRPSRFSADDEQVNGNTVQSESNADASSWEQRGDNGYREERQPRQDREPRQDRQPRQERPARVSTPPRDESPREDRPRDERPRDERPREERAPRRPRFAEARDESEQNIAAEPTRDARGPDAPLMLDLAVLPPAIAPLADSTMDDGAEAAPAPKKRGRPRKIVAEAE